MGYEDTGIPDRIGIWKCCFFEERGKPDYPVAHMTSSPGIEPRPHWWEACVGGKVEKKL